MIDKQFCMSSFLAFRYIERKDVDFFEGLKHNILPFQNEMQIPVKTATDIDHALQKQFDAIKGKRLGILLSGGMDSAILASYMHGADAYTFRFLNGNFQREELQRAEYYAHYYGLRLHYVDIDWHTVEKYLRPCMDKKGAPVHSIEPQIMAGAVQAKEDGIDMMVIGDASDYIFGGMDQLLSKDWTYNEFVERYTYIRPENVLRQPADVSYLYERYRTGENSIDWLRMMDDITIEESYASYSNAFAASNMPYIDPYEILTLAEPLDLSRIRNGESKYLIRELFRSKYPDIPVPNKIPMPRPVDFYFKDWQGPTRPEFRRDLDISKFTGNQKWQLWCLEQFLNLHEPLRIGYTTGVYDLFHIGHLNLLRKSKAECDYLIVGVSTDDLVEYKGKRAVIPFEERKEIVGAIRYVDEVVTQEDMNKFGAWEKYHFNVMFVGDDWKGTDKWNKIEADMKNVGVEVVYFPYTKGTSSTLINETLKHLRNK